MVLYIACMTLEPISYLCHYDIAYSVSINFRKLGDI